MRNGQCPKCGSTDIRTGSQGFGGYAPNSIRITFFGYAPLDNYLCIACGYVECYVAGSSDRRRIGEKWPKVQPG